MKHEQKLKRRGRRGQTMAEFALTLPIVLLLTFGVIEFARLFQAWVTLQNSARSAVRYGVTGNWDPESVKKHNNDTGTTDQVQILDNLVPCQIGNTNRFLEHWGVGCDPGSDDHQGLRIDMARLPSIVDRARVGAAGLTLLEGDNIVGMKRGDGSDMNSEPADAETTPGWFHVWICSSRPPVNVKSVDGVTVPARYLPSANRNDRICQVVEPSTGFGPDPGDNQYDAGGPGDVLEVVVHYNAPLITPVKSLLGWTGIEDYIRMTARRVGVNESFRSTRAINLPPQLNLPTFTPSITPTPTDTFTPSPTATRTASMTETATETTSATASPTHTPDCGLITIQSASLISTYLQLRVRNDNFAPMYISGASIEWRPWISQMYTASTNIVGRDPHWIGNDTTPPTVIGNGVGNGTWFHDTPFWRQFNGGGAVTTWQVRFANGPTDLTTAGYTIHDFAGTNITFEWEGGSCTLALDIATPTVDSNVPTNTPTPDCSDFTMTFERFEVAGVVVFKLINTGPAAASITAFNVSWVKYTASMFLHQVELGVFTYGNPANVTLWSGNDGTPPTSANAAGGGDPTWGTTPVINAGQTLFMFVDFDGLGGIGSLTSYGAYQSDFNGTYVTFDDNCVEGPVPVPTPGPTSTPAPTNTRTPTRTPTRTFTPGGPTNTFTPIPPTRTPTPTNQPTRTPTQTRTPTPIIPPTICVEGC